MQKLIRRSVIGASAMVFAAVGSTVPAFADGGGTYQHGHHVKARSLLRADLIGSLTADPTLFGVAPGGVDWTVSRSRSPSRPTDASMPGCASCWSPPPTPTRYRRSRPAWSVTVPSSTRWARSRSARRGTRGSGRFTVPARCLAPAVLLNPLDRVGTYIAASGVAG